MDAIMLYSNCGESMGTLQFDSTMNNIMISIIIPVYNVIDYIEEALDSVIHQTYQNLQIIVVDDGSTDGSGLVCDEYAKKDKRITVIHQENKGLSAARNAGLDIAKGEYIAFLDSDDAFHREMIEHLLGVAQNENADIITCDIASFWTQKKMKELRIRRHDYKCLSKTAAMHAAVKGEITCLSWDKLYASYLGWCKVP